MSACLLRHSGESRNPVQTLMLPDPLFLDSGLRRNDGFSPTFSEDTP